MFKRILVVFLLIISFSCEIPEGLSSVSGVEGVIQFTGEWPGELEAVALLALDELEFDDLADHLITYSAPISKNTSDDIYYFLQLNPGRYFLSTIGLTVKPSLLAANLDSFLQAPDVPIIILDDLQTISRAVFIQSGSIEIINRQVNF
ncbi:hypothetical protein ACFL46_04425 [Candidatus Neomarinimicrobiota bacterium]